MSSIGPKAYRCLVAMARFWSDSEGTSLLSSHLKQRYIPAWVPFEFVHDHKIPSTPPPHSEEAGGYPLLSSARMLSARSEWPLSVLGTSSTLPVRSWLGCLLTSIRLSSVFVFWSIFPRSCSISTALATNLCWKSSGISSLREVGGMKRRVNFT